MSNEDLKEEFVQDLFEVGRRNKTANPSMMRTSYQMLMHILQDAVIYNPSFIGKKFEKSKQFKKILTVGDVINKIKININDILFVVGLRNEGMKLNEIESKYGKIGVEVVLSIKDGIEASSKSCGEVYNMMKHLETFEELKKETDLSISYGVDGSMMTQNHQDHFDFVHQSLALWWNVMRHMPMLWIVTDKDFLCGKSYTLCNTGQGLQRMQTCVNVSSVMHNILSQTECNMCKGKSWKGLSVIHLADRDVPNCLFFIDKYSQVPWILSPIIRTVERLESGEENKRIPYYFEEISCERWGNAICRHFLRQGFNASGSDGGSCIDGRLTSAWNWCSMIEKYAYYPLFLICDFEGFEGPYKK